MSGQKTALGAIVLAAGNSIRMGKPKQLIKLRGITLLEHTHHVIANSLDGPILIVTGETDAAIRHQLCHTKSQHTTLIKKCPDHNEGMGKSLAFGVQELCSLHNYLKGIIIFVCDQPFLNSELILSMTEKHLQDPEQRVACRYEENNGPPVLFPRSDFNALMKLRGDQGARHILEDKKNRLSLISFPLGAIDLDTPKDLAALTDLPLTA